LADVKGDRNSERGGVPIYFPGEGHHKYQLITDGGMGMITKREDMPKRTIDRKSKRSKASLHYTILRWGRCGWIIKTTIGMGRSTAQWGKGGSVNESPKV